MTISEESIKVLIELADRKYRAAERTEADLLQCRALYAEALAGSIAVHGATSEHTGYIHNALGLVYFAMDDHFEAGEESFEAAVSVYKSAASLAIVLNNHADLLLKMAKLIEEEVQELKEELRKEREAPPRPLLPTRRERLMKVFRQAIRNFRIAWRQDQRTATEGRPRDIQSELTATMQEATNAYRKASDLKNRAIKLKNESEGGSASGASGGANSGTHSESRNTQAEGPVKMSSSRAVALHNGPAFQPFGASRTSKMPPHRTPAEIFAALDEVAIGQRSAKRGLANAASQHMKRMRLSAEERAKTDKSNVLIMGPTGCGKTLLAEALATVINVPFYRTEATKLTASGYIGEDVQSILAGLLRAADFDVERAQTGIVFLDEIDKKARSSASQLDVGGKTVQEELLTILEGTKISVPGKNKGETIEIDTTNILFIVGGAFVGLGEIVQQRLCSGGATIGFSADLRRKEEDPNSYLKFVTAADFIKFGLIPEFVGRLPKRLFIETLTVEQLERILTEPKKALLLQKRILLKGTTDLKFTRSAVRAMAQEAHKIGTNGRALREIVEQVLEPIVFTEPKAVVITEAMVTSRRSEIASTNEEVKQDGEKKTPDYIVEDGTPTAAITVPGALAPAGHAKA